MKGPLVTLNIANMSSRKIENKPKMTFWNFALMCYNDIDHLVIYHLKVVSEMYRKILNSFSWINDVSRGVVVDVNINFDTCTAWQGQMFGWLFFWQDVRVVDLSITHDYLFLFLFFHWIQVLWKFNLKLCICNFKFLPWFAPA